MAGNSNVTNTFTQDSFNFSFHTNEKSGDQSHFLFQDNGVSAGVIKFLTPCLPMITPSTLLL
jgi:hypothetical protein